MGTTTETQVNPSKIMQTGTAFWASKTLLTAVKMKLFTILSKRELTGAEIQSRLALHKRSLYDFLDALVALGFLKRKGLKDTAVCRNAEDTDLFLDKNKQSYMGGMLEMCNNRLYHFWNDLEEGLKTSLPQNETKNGGKPVFEEIYADPTKLREFVRAMGGIQMENFISFSKQFDFSSHKTLCDIGGSGGLLSIQVALHNPNMKCIPFDLPLVGHVAKNNIKNSEVDDQINVQSGDFFTDEFPKADVITMGNILRDWGAADKKNTHRKSLQCPP